MGTQTRLKKPPLMARRCIQCGEAFTAVNVSQKTCSEPCRFWSKVERGSDAACWEWKAAKTSGGYGSFTVEGCYKAAHRHSYELVYGVLRDDLMVLHRCDNPACVNPRHLYLGTQSENMKDKFRRGRDRTPSGERSPHSKLTEEQVRRVRTAPKGVLIRLMCEFGLSRSQAARIRRGESWKAVAV